MRIVLEVVGVRDEEAVEFNRQLNEVMGVILQRDEVPMMSQYFKIFKALLKTGSMKGIKNGSANIHYDFDGNFKGIEHSYWPWKERLARN